MAVVAHDSSSPASLKPGDIARQQPSRPDSPDKGKPRVFISRSTRGPMIAWVEAYQCHRIADKGQA
jgi:hypothetical protein